MVSGVLLVLMPEGRLRRNPSTLEKGGCRRDTLVVMAQESRYGYDSPRDAGPGRRNGGREGSQEARLCVLGIYAFGMALRRQGTDSLHAFGEVLGYTFRRLCGGEP